MFIYPFSSNKYHMVVNNKIIDNKFINQIDYEFEGYLEVPKYNIRRLIKCGDTNEVLSSNYALYYNSFTNLDKNTGSIILLGHNIESVFHFLHYLDIDDEVILVTHEKCYHFIIYDIDVIDERNIEIMNRNMKNKTLVLITCMSNNKKRLVLLGKIKN